MAHSYFTEADFYRLASGAAPYLRPDRPLYGWSLKSANVYQSFQTGAVGVLKRDGEDLGSPEANLAAVTEADEWFYDSDLDTTYIFGTASPNLSDMTASEDHATYMAAMIQKASRLVDARLDAYFKVPIIRNRSGSYDEVIKQIAIYELAMMVSADDPIVSERYKTLISNEDDDGILDELIVGKRKFEYEVSAKEGSLTEVSVSGGFYPRILGAYTGSGHERLKISIPTGGAAGTATFQVFGYDDAVQTPKTLEWLTTGGDIIELYQLTNIGAGLSIVWDADDGDTATTDDEWEYAAFGSGVEVTNPGIKSISVVRG